MRRSALIELRWNRTCDAACSVSAT